MEITKGKSFSKITSALIPLPLSNETIGPRSFGFEQGGRVRRYARHNVSSNNEAREHIWLRT